VRQVTIEGRWLIGEWVDQLCRVGRAASGEHGLGRVACDDVGTDVRMTPVLAGDLEATQPRLGCLVEPADLQQYVALRHGDL
jgi:hypothetical protein